MRGVPVAVVVEAAGLFEHAGQFHAARAHVVDIGAGAVVAVLKCALLLGLASEDFVVAVRVKGRVDVDEIDALRGELLELVEIVAAINGAGVHEGGGFCGSHAADASRARAARSIARVPRGAGCAAARARARRDFPPRRNPSRATAARPSRRHRGWRRCPDAASAPPPRRSQGMGASGVTADLLNIPARGLPPFADRSG